MQTTSDAVTFKFEDGSNEWVIYKGKNRTVGGPSLYDCFKTAIYFGIVPNNDTKVQIDGNHVSYSEFLVLGKDALNFKA